MKGTLLFRLSAFAILTVFGLRSMEAQVIQAPWSEPFTAVASGVGTYNLNSTIPLGWTRTPATTGFTMATSTYFWGGRQGATPTRFGGSATGPAADHTSGTGGYVYIESSGGLGGAVSSLDSPPIRTVGIAMPELIFWKHQYGTTMGLLKVYVRAYGTTAWNSPIYTGTNTNLGDFWTRVALPLPLSFANDTVEVRFEITKPAGGGGGGPGGNNQLGDLAIDDVSIAELVACPDPTSIVATRLSATSVQLSWVTGGASAWRVTYGPAGFMPAAGTKLNASTNPFIITGLSPATTYEFRVKDSCSATSVSGWSNAARAMTDCGPIATPWSENFDGPSFVIPTAHWAYGAIDTCWSRPSGANYWWRPNSGPTPTALTNIGTGPSADHTTGSGKYLHGEAQAGTGVALLRSPNVLLAGLITPELRFYYHQFGAQIDSLVVKVFRNGTETRVWANTIGTSSSTAPWSEAVVSLSSFLPDTVQIRWYAYRSPSGNNQVDVAIDDVSIANIPACAKPLGLTVTGTTQTTGTMTWNPTGAGTYEVRYGALGQVPFSGTTVTASTNPFTLTGLSAGTVYAVSVRKVCSSALQSAWSTIDTLITLCGVVSAPYIENFEVGFDRGPASGQFWNQNSTVGPCWVRTPLSSPAPPAYHWGGGQGATPTPNTGPANDHTSGLGKYVYTEAGFGNPAGSARIAYLTSPQISLNGLTAPEIRFWYHMQGTTIGSLTVEVQTGSVTSPFVALDSIVGGQANAWLERVVSLGGYVNQTVRIRFKARTLSTTPATLADIAIDDFTVKNAPPCPPPTALSATPLTSTTASISFTNAATGTAILEYGPVGFTPGSGTLVSTTSNPHILTGLTQGQNYQVYVFDSCSGGLTSGSFGPVSFSTFNCPNGCVYTLKLQDNFGDGWRSNPAGNYHRMEVIVNSDTTSYTILDQLPGNVDTVANYSITVCDNDVIKLRFVAANNGNWSGESGWQFRNASGALVHSEATGGANLTTGVKYTGTADCANPCPPPVAAFTTTATGLSVLFDAATSVGSIVSWAWDFGSGATGTGLNPSHTFATFGTYLISLIVTDGCGQSDTIVQSINVCTGGLGSVGHSANGLVVNFTGPSDPAQFSSINWAFGDGNSSASASPTHTYTAGGTYSVILTATDICGNTYSQTLSVVACSKPIAYFTFRILASNGSGMTVEFDASNSVDAVSYSWIWGDGSAGSGGPILNHTYPVAQLGYNVRLIVQSNCGTTDTISHRLTELSSAEVRPEEASWFPNPVRSGSQISYSNQWPEAPEFCLWYAFDGRLLKEVPVVDGRAQVPTLSSGIYWLVWNAQHSLQRIPIAIID
jgi:PKD repeat protein